MNWYRGEHQWRLLPGGLAALALGVAFKLGLLLPLEQIAYRALFQARGALPWDDRLVLIAIDETSLKQLGRFPWSRKEYVKLFKTLSPAEPAVVVVDLLWSEASPDDAKLAQAMMQQNQVVLAQAWDATGVPLVPVATLNNAAIATGHVLKREDSDGLVRRVDLQMQDQPSLAVATAQTYSLVQKNIKLPPLEQPIWLNWIAPAAKLQQYSFVDVVQGKVPPQAFQAKIVLLGVTATGMDSMVTPFDRNPPSSSVYLHATLLQNLLQQNYLRPLDESWMVFILLLGGPGLSWLMGTHCTRQQLVVISGLCFGWMMVSLLALRASYLLPVATPIAVFATTASAVALTERLRENYLLRQQVESLWHRYRQDLVVPVVEPSQPLLPVQMQTLPNPSGVMLRVAQLSALAELFGRSQAAQMAIARSLSTGLLAADMDGTVWFCNPAAATWLQAKIGSPLQDQLVPTWLSQRQWQSCLKSLKAGHASKHINLQYGEQWFDLHLEPLVYRDPIIPNTATSQTDQQDGFLLLLEDVTEHKQTETELNQSKNAAEAANRAKSEFLANISHELRTPLNAILGFSQVMSHDRALNPEQQQHLAIINRSGKHLLGLINDVLEMSKIEAGRVKLNETNFDLHHLLTSLQGMLQLKATAKQLILSFEYTPDLPQYIKTDEGKLRQVLLNLLGNAIKFTQAGHVILRVKPVQTEKPQAIWIPNPDICLRFEVEDTGPGIATEEVKHLFEAFSQTMAGRQSNEGTGLGLSISRKFVNLMGGDISVHSIMGQGSTFQFDIWADLALSNDLPMAPETRRVDALRSNQATHRILIVEDQWESSQMLMQLLKPLGFEMREVRDGQAAVQLWQTWNPHLILMDLRMPVMDGFEATRQIRSMEKQQRRGGEDRRGQSTQSSPSSPSPLSSPSSPQPSTKILALTASVFEDTRAAVMDAGCDDFLRKPIEETILLAKLAEHLGIEYVYKTPEQTDENSDDGSKEPTTTDLHQELAQMPEEWVKQLAQAAITGSDRIIFQLLEQTSQTYPLLTSTLTTWNNDFQFDKITDLIKQVSGKAL